MSQEVDSRVVEMRFDNANFEKNTKQTISTIDRLMEKLQFKGAEKGFEKLDAAAENVDFATMQTSLDRLESKFSSLNIVATTALVNITNKFVDAGEKLVKSLSIDQVASGWDKYTEKTSNVQTIMNATGKSIDQVNGYLNKLMWYSDETSYSFSEMTSALSQMTAAGGNIALIQDGDIIEIDIPNRSINVKLTDEELAARPMTPVTRDRRVSKALKAYASMVSSADKGAVRLID